MSELHNWKPNKRTAMHSPTKSTAAHVLYFIVPIRQRREDEGTGLAVFKPNKNSKRTWQHQLRPTPAAQPHAKTSFNKISHAPIAQSHQLLLVRSPGQVVNG
jgi:hypothetical protein